MKILFAVKAKKKYNRVMKTSKKEYDRLRYLKNKERIKEQVRLYQILNKTKRIKYAKEYSKKYYKSNTDSVLRRVKLHYQKNKKVINTKTNLYRVRKRQTDIDFNTSLRIRSRFNNALKRQNITKEKSIIVYGVNIRDIINHLGPCPGDRSDYHIDHIKPLSLFDLSKKNEIQKAFAPTNHQWLLKEDNLSKGNKC